MPVPTAPAGTVDALACEYAAIVLEHAPPTATALGLHDRNAELPVPTQARIDAYERALRDLRARVDAHAAEGMDAELDRKGLRAILDAALAGFELQRPWERDPLSWARAPVEAVFLVLLREHLPEEERRAGVAGRCAAIPDYLAAARQLLVPAAVPPAWTALASASAAGGASFLRDVVAGFAPEAEDAVAAAADALESFGAWVTDTLAPEAGGAYVAGEQTLQRLLRDVHLLDEGPAEVAARGQLLLARCEDALVDAAGAADWRAALERARAARPTMDELVPAYRREFQQLEEFCFEHDLVTDPGAPATLKATPEFLRPLMGYAAYLPPGAFEEVRTGELWVTPPPAPDGLADHSYAALQPITAHEGYPGHHLQLTSVGALGSVVRRLRGGSSLMTEGWGLYTEELMHETGYYTPEGRLAQLALTAMRAARIVVDMGLHTGDMTVDEGIDLLVDRAGMSRTTATSEVLRYTMMPTQPFTYLYGAEEIRRIRATWRERTGGSLRAFHDALLAYGHLPPALVARALLDGDAA